ncbi:MAG: hypothetical protein ACRDGD_08480 [Candidatus Limnocylindria bacterium]
MSTDRDATRIVRSWLKTDGHEDAGRVVDAVLELVDTTPQRRSTWWQARRIFPMSNALRIAVASVAVVAALTVGAYYLAASGGVRIGGPESPTATPTPMPPQSRGGPLEPGTYLITAIPELDITVTIPEGWSGFQSWGLIGPRSESPPDGMGIGFWEVGNLYADPLESGFVDPPIGPSVDDLVAGLIDQPGHTEGEPVDVTIDGYAGRMIELRLPADIAFDSCFVGTVNYRLWVSASHGGWRCLQGPGQIERVWVLDVDGTRVVIDAHHFPGTSEADRAALDAVIESIQIEVDPLDED